MIRGFSTAFRLVLLAGLAGVAGGLACGPVRSTTDAPRAVLAQSAEANASLLDRRRDLERAAEPAERGPMLLRMAQHITRYEGDPSCDVVRVYMALVWLEAGEPDQAARELNPLSALPVGSTRDLYTVAKAKMLRLQGKNAQALEILRPLSGKIIDEVDRQIFLEELCQAAIGARLDYEAMAYLDTWLRGTAVDDRPRVRERVKSLLRRVGREVLEGTLRTIRSQAMRAGYSVDFQRVLNEQLAEVAVNEGDAVLARWLLESSTVGADSETPGLGQLAASRRGLRVIFGRTVGLLVTDGSTELRDRSAEIARGVAWALGLYDPKRARETETRLVTRNDGGATSYAEAALEEMAGEGVSVVIAGVDRASAERALTWCEKHGLPLILLSPAPVPPEKHGYVLGSNRADELTLLATAMAAKGSSRLLVVTQTEGERALEVGAIESAAGVSLAGVSACDAAPPKPGSARYPFDLIAADKKAGVLVSGSRSCGKTAIDELIRYVRAPLPLAFTLDAWPGVTVVDRLSRATRVVVTSSGSFPFTAREQTPDESLAAYAKEYGAQPTWWAALGRDAASLAARAVSPLPKNDTRDDAQVSQRRAVVEAGLLMARSRLWTTTAQGFGREHAMKRDLATIVYEPK